MNDVIQNVPASSTGEQFPFGVAVASLSHAWGYSLDAPAKLPAGSTYRHQAITGDIYAIATVTPRE